jgi:hypothetical protein
MDDQVNKKLIVGGGLAAAALAVVAYFWLRSEPEPPPAPPPKPVEQAEQPAHYPVPEAQPAPASTLPPLAESDAALLESLKGLFTGEALQQYLVPNDIVRRMVVTIDNLPRKKVAERLKPVKAIEGPFRVTGPEEERVIAPDNADRYRALMQLVNITDMEQVAAIYVQFYPLFQEAYRDLGYPDAYFNNRVVEVIDHLLATPTVPGPIKLIQPSVMYEYADPKLEALSAGQKTLIRMGPAHAETIKRKLRELRVAVTKKQE